MAKTFKFDKIIRDKLYEQYEAEGVGISYAAANDEMMQQYFKKKLLEEIDEVFESKTREELVEEIADVIEVMRGLAKNFDITAEEIEHVRSMKASKKGSFHNPKIIQSITLKEGHNYTDYFEKRPEKYPEINTKSE